MFALFSRFFLARDELGAKASKFFRTRDKGLALTWIEPAAPKRVRCFTCHASRTRASRTKIARHAEPHCDARVVALAVFSERSWSVGKSCGDLRVWNPDHARRAPTSIVPSHIVGAAGVLASIVALVLSLALAE